MKVSDIFRIGKKTIFAGELMPSSVKNTKGLCRIEIDGNCVEVVEIEGEVQTGRDERDLWTKSNVSISKDDVDGKDVWLVSEVETTCSS
jgi:hypothetical protein